jgi:prepilin-type N-terminal cleavage/methylation domain-containing protein
MRNKGFTLIEVLVATTLMAVAIIPAALISMAAVMAAAEGDAWTMASNLARREMGIVSILPYADATLATGYNNLTSNYQGYKYNLRRQVTAVAGTTDLKQVAITVYPAGSTAKTLEIDTYVINNVTTGLGTGGGSVSPEGGSLSNTGAGSWSGGNRTRNVTAVSNTSPDGNITIVGVYIWRAAGTAFNLTSATMDAATVWTGTLAVPTSQPASPNVVLTASCIIGPSSSVASNTFVFSAAPAVGLVISTKYRMSDGTDSATYSFSR